MLPRSTWSPLVPNFSKTIDWERPILIQIMLYFLNVILINKKLTGSPYSPTEDFLKDNINWFETTKKF